MNTKTGKSVKEKSWVLPGVKLTHREFIDGIRKAEEGPFYTLEEIKEMRKQWRSSRKNS
jgi:hypothetical protein